jgi:hypothetical protein
VITIFVYVWINNIPILRIGMFERYRYRKDYRKKQQADKKKIRDLHKAGKKKYRAERRRMFLRKFLTFLSNPFADRKLNPEQELRREVRIQLKLEQKARKKIWIGNFRQNPIKTLFAKKKDEDKLLLEQWRKTNKKVAFRKKIKDFRNALSEVVKSPELRRRFSLSLLQSTAYFTLSFLLVYVIYQAITILTAYLFNIPTIWYYYRVTFPLFTGSHLYTRVALISIFAIGPFISLGLAFMFLRFFFSRKQTSHGLKLFFLWGFICGANFFFGSYVVGFVTRTEFIYATEWIFMSSMFDVEEIIFTVISMTIALLIGRLATPLFLLTAGSEKMIAPNFRLIFILTQVFFPWLFGVLIFQVLTTPQHYFPFTLKTITPLFILVPTLFTFNSVRNENIRVSGVVKKNYFRWSIVILVIAILFFYRVLLNFGLKLF